MWLSEALCNDIIQPSQVARHSGGPEAATQWLQTNYDQIPEQLRPLKEDVVEFGAFFSTYLTSTFEVVELPGTRGQGRRNKFCQCELCLRILDAHNLRTRKVYARHKRQANVLMAECIEGFAQLHRVKMDDEQIWCLVTDRKTRRDCAYLAYGEWLIKRLSGESDGASILALWRLIAWDPQGGMRRGFTLRIEDFQSAESRLFGCR